MLDTTTMHFMDTKDYQPVRVKPKISLGVKITKQKLSYFSNGIKADSLKKKIMLGLVNGKRRGHPSTYWHDTIRRDTSMILMEL